jgi:nitrate reductase gamma subunit
MMMRRQRSLTGDEEAPDMMTALVVCAFCALSLLLGGLCHILMGRLSGGEPFIERIAKILAELLFAVSLFGLNRLLWGAVLVFRLSLILVLGAHLRYFWSGDIPPWIISIQGPASSASVVLALSLFLILVIRLSSAPVIMRSSPADYLFTILLLLASCAGLTMRYFYPVDICGAKDFMVNLLAFRVAPDEPSIMFPSLTFAFHFLAALVIVGLFPLKGMHALNRPMLQQCGDDEKRQGPGAGGIFRAPVIIGIVAFLIFVSLAFFAGGLGSRPVPMPLRNGTGPYAMVVEKKRDKATLYHNPLGWWRVSHGTALNRKDHSSGICMRCHSEANHCNRCHRYGGAKMMEGLEK